MLFTTGGMHVEQLLIHKSMLMWAGHLMVSHTFVGKTHHDFQKGIGSIYSRDSVGYEIVFGIIDDYFEKCNM